MSLHARGLGGGVSSLAPRYMHYYSAQLMSKMGSVAKVTRGVKRSYRERKCALGKSVTAFSVRASSSPM